MSKDTTSFCLKQRKTQNYVYHNFAQLTVIFLLCF